MQEKISFTTLLTVKHIACESLSTYSNEQKLNEFKETHLKNLSEFQKDKLRELLAYCEVMKHVTVTIEPSKYGAVSLFSRDPAEIEKRKLIFNDQEERKKQQKLEHDKINRAINYHYKKNKELIV